MRNKKEKPEDVFWCNRGMLPIYYCFCPNKTAWENFTKKYKIKEKYPFEVNNNIGGKCVSFYNQEDCTICCVLINENLDDNDFQVYSFFVHEAVHVYQEAIKEMGEEAPGKEFEAYTIQFIFMNLLDAYNKTRRGKNKNGK